MVPRVACMLSLFLGHANAAKVTQRSPAVLLKGNAPAHSKDLQGMGN